MKLSSRKYGGKMHVHGARTRFATILIFVVLLVSALPIAAFAQKPDFSGLWTLDVQASDDPESRVLEGAGQDSTHGMTHLERDRLLERLIELARAINEIEIEQTERDLKVFDRNDNVRIYYLDGDKRVRQTPWGANLDVVARWEGDQIAVHSTGREIGEVQETFGVEGRRLVFIVRIKNENFENEIAIRNYYDRTQ